MQTNLEKHMFFFFSSANPKHCFETSYDVISGIADYRKLRRKGKKEGDALGKNTKSTISGAINFTELSLASLLSIEK